MYEYNNHDKKNKMMKLIVLCFYFVIFVNANELCGLGSNWRKEYHDRHQSMINGHIPGRYIINVPVEAGLADIVFGYVAGFIWALLTNRTFLIIHDEHLRRIEYGYCVQRTIEHAYLPHGFDWIAPYINKSHYNCMAPLYENLPECKDSKLKLFPNDNKELTYSHVYQVNGGLKDIFYNGDLDKVKSTDIIFFNSNRGITYHIFDNPLYKDKLTNMGFTRNTLFGCIFHFLFKMNNDVCIDNCKETESKLIEAGKNHIIRIGIQVRNQADSNAYEHTKCVSELVNYYESNNHQVVILLISANIALQRNMKDKYKEKLLLPLGKPATVIEIHDREETHKDNAIKISNCTNEVLRDKQSMLDSARDVHLLSLTDIQVVSRDSGFGILGAMNRPRTHPIIYKMRLGVGGANPNCADNLNGDNITLFADTWSGF